MWLWEVAHRSGPDPLYCLALSLSKRLGGLPHAGRTLGPFLPPERRGDRDTQPYVPKWVRAERTPGSVLNCGGGSFWFVRPVGRPVHHEALITLHGTPTPHKSARGPAGRGRFPSMAGAQPLGGIGHRWSSPGQSSVSPPTVLRPRRRTANRLAIRCSGASCRSASVTFTLLR